MFLASFLIGLREGMEAALIIGILVAFLKRENQHSAISPLKYGVISAILLSLLFGAIFTFGSQSLSFQTQEILGGSMSILAVVMITGMVFWMFKLGVNMRAELEGTARNALGGNNLKISMFWIAFISVGREGVETTLMLWGWAMQPLALLGALAGIITASIIGYFVYRGMLHINFRVFFAWTGAFLIVVAAGILAYGIHDLQEAAILPGPFSGAPITPTNFRTGEVLTGFFTTLPYWGAAYPFGWAFDLQNVISPDGFLGAFLKGTIGFTPLMSWLEITAWAIYLLVVFPAFIRRVRATRPQLTQVAGTCPNCTTQNISIPSERTSE